MVIQPLKTVQIHTLVTSVGHLTGSGQRRVDPDRLKAIKDMKISV